MVRSRTKIAIFIFRLVISVFDVNCAQDLSDGLLWSDTDSWFDYGSGNESSGEYPIDDEPDYQGSGDITYSYGTPADSDLYNEGGMICGDGTKIGEKEICNGQVDCYDCSDEAKCAYDTHKIFLCYETGDTAPVQFTFDDPKCISLTKFCDGKQDCRNGADERQNGPGFLCTVTDRFRQCILPQRFLCDDMAHCEDHSDMCPNVGGGTSTDYDYSGILTASDLRTAETPHGMFRCLDGKLIISQNQMCDGRFDCSDLSDECLCEVQKSDVVKQVCGGLCANPLWRDQPSNPNCKFCNHGEIYWKLPLSLSNATETITHQESPCYSPNDIWEKVESFVNMKSMSRDEKSDYDTIDCFDATMTPIRARKCDGRPECVYGEDECGIGCNANASDMNGGYESSGDFGDKKTNSTDPEFCRLLISDLTGFACLSWLEDNGAKMPKFRDMQHSRYRINVCDGKTDCDDGSDEMFCPTRLPCENKTSESFDVAQRCDGYSHCLNGMDENPLECQSESNVKFPCDDRSTSGNSVVTFTRSSYLDGKKNCETGADECPPFFNKISTLKDIMYDDRRAEQQIGVSSHDAVIGSMPLQTFVITISLIGASALAVSLALGLYNVTVAWIRLCKSGVELTRRSFVIYTREVVVNIGITLAKGLLCGYFAYIRIARSEESNYSMIDLDWRSSQACGIAGSIALIGCQIPVMTVSIFIVTFLAFDSVCRKWERQKIKITQTETGVTERNYPKNEAKKRNTPVAYHVAMFAVCCGFITIIWLPIVLLAIVLRTPSDLYLRTQTYGWLAAKGASPIFQANLLSQDSAMDFACKVMALAPNASESSDLIGTFSFFDVPNIVNNISRDLRVESLGTFGYYSQSGTCLPAFLVNVVGGEPPFDIAVSNHTTLALSITLVAINFVLIFCAGALNTSYGAGAFKICVANLSPSYNDRHVILNHTFSRLIAIETITWVIIALFFLLKSIDPEIASDRTYATVCIVVIGLNCGIVTPFILLMRKFRTGNLTEHKQVVRLRSRGERAGESQRILEVQEINEKQQTTKQNHHSYDDAVKSEEAHSLIGDVSDLATT